MPGGDDLDDGLVLDASLVADDASDPPSPARGLPLDEEDAFELECKCTKRSPPHTMTSICRSTATRRLARHPRRREETQARREARPRTQGDDSLGAIAVPMRPTHPKPFPTPDSPRSRKSNKMHLQPDISPCASHLQILRRCWSAPSSRLSQKCPTSSVTNSRYPVRILRHPFHPTVHMPTVACATWPLVSLSRVRPRTRF